MEDFAEATNELFEMMREGMDLAGLDKALNDISVKYELDERQQKKLERSAGKMIMKL